LLEKYLTAPVMAVDGTRQSSIFLCPAADRAAHGKAVPAYIVSMVPFPAYGQCAWGDPALDQQPLFRSALGSIGDIVKNGAPLSLSGLWAIKDADAAYFTEVSNSWTVNPGGLLPKPAHGDHRNALFFDFHAERVEIIHFNMPSSPTPEPGSDEGSVN